MTWLPKRILNIDETAERVGVSRAALVRIGFCDGNEQQNLPKPFRGPQSGPFFDFFWLEHEIDAWVERRFAPGHASDIALEIYRKVEAERTEK